MKKIRRVNFKRLIANLAIVVLLVGVIVINVSTLQANTDTKSIFAVSKKLPIYYVDNDKNEISISFDAAWGADKTKAILDVLDAYKIKSTFFLCDFWTKKFPELVKEIDARGHIIGSHSMTHPHFNSLSYSQKEKELIEAGNKITEVTGKKVNLFRPPFGEYNDELISLCEKNGIYPVMWDVDSLDWKLKSASDIVARVKKGVKSGSIVLFHNNSDNIVEVLNEILPYLIKQGFTFKTIDDLIYKQNYYMDTNGKQIAKP